MSSATPTPSAASRSSPATATCPTSSSPGLRGPGRRRASWRWPTRCSGPATARECSSSTPRTTGCCRLDLILYWRLVAVWIGCLMVDPCFCRGLDVVRNKIKMFAQKKVTLPPGRHKIVILDEADSMTTGAQQALRRTMEIYSNTTRFALACNTSSKIIEPIQSRCAIVRFSRLSDQEILGRLMIVVAAEKVPYVPEGLEAIIFTADGDMRQALNNLQATVSGFRFVNQENVFKVCDQPHPLHVKSMVKNVLDGKFDEACSGLKQLYDLGYSPTDIITTLFRVIKNYDMAEFLKLELLKETGFAHMRICDGVGSFLQLSGLLAKFALVRETAKA
ncbi:hypothetical protein VPH35_022752 [Triticum aestivum]